MMVARFSMLYVASGYPEDADGPKLQNVADNELTDRALAIMLELKELRRELSILKNLDEFDALD